MVNAKSITAGAAHVCAVTGSTRVVRCWGANAAGQLGDGTTKRRTRAVAATGLASVISVAAGSAHTCARTAARIACWGSNASGQLGDGTHLARLRPTTVPGAGSTAGLASGAAHTCLLPITGGAVCWGSNGRGRLGDGTTTSTSTPVAVIRLVAASMRAGTSREVLPPDGMTVAVLGARVVDASGQGICGVPITFTMTSGDAALGAASRYTSCAGAAESTLKASSTPGSNTIEILATGTSLASSLTIEESASGSLAVTESPGVSVVLTVTTPTGAQSTLRASQVSMQSAAAIAIGSTVDVAVTTDASATAILLVDGLLTAPVSPPAGSIQAASATRTTNYKVEVQGNHELAAGLYELAPGVQVLGDDSLAVLTGVSEDKDTLVFTGSTPQLDDLQPGTIIVGNDPRFPNGLRSTVSSITTRDGVTTVSTTPADLRAVFGRLSIDYNSRLREDAGAVVPSASAGFATNAAGSYDVGMPISAIEFTVDSARIPNTPFGGSATVSFKTPRLSGCWEWDWLTLKCAEVSINGGVGVEADLDVRLIERDFLIQITKYQVIAAVPIAPFVAIVPVWSSAFVVSVDATAGLQWKWEATTKAGVRYYDGVGLQPVFEANATGTGLLEPSLEVAGSVKVRPTLSVDFTIDAVCGVGVEMAVPAVKGEIEVLPARTWKVSAGLEVAPEVACFFGHKVFDGVGVYGVLGEGTWGPPPDQTLPVVSGVTLDPPSALTGQQVVVSAWASDPQGIASADFRIDNGEWTSMVAMDGYFGSANESVGAAFSVGVAGTHDICVRATDTNGAVSASPVCESLTVEQDPGQIGSPGGLQQITISPDLNCSVVHENSATSDVFYSGTACGTLMAAGGVLYGPADIPAGGSATPRTPWTPVYQSGSGSGTRSDPWVLRTIVNAGTSGIALVQRDSYVVGDPYWTTSVQVYNDGGQAADVIVYRAADCYIGSDYGYGHVDEGTGAVRCVNDGAGRWLEWLPITPGSHYFEGYYADMWSLLGWQGDLPDTTRASEYIDNAAALSWRVSVPSGSSRTVSHRLQVIWPSALEGSTVSPQDQGAAGAASDLLAARAVAKARAGDAAGAAADFDAAIAQAATPAQADKIAALEASVQPDGR
jgi:hypothetical protein